MTQLITVKQPGEPEACHHRFSEEEHRGKDAVKNQDPVQTEADNWLSENYPFRTINGDTVPCESIRPP